MPATYRQHGAYELPRLGLAALPWIFLILMVPAGPQIKPPMIDKFAWLASDLSAAAFLILHRDRAKSVIGTKPIILAWPILAIASAAWSLTPGVTAYHGAQLLGTVLAGFALRSSLGLSRVVRIIFFGLLCGQILSVFLGVAAPGLTRGLDGEWSGIYPHKNVLGSMMSLQLICAACLFFQRWNRLLTGAAFFGAVILLWSSHSATALFAGMVGLAPLAAILAWRQGNQVMGLCLGLGVALAGAGLTIAIAYGGQITTNLLADLGKDTTLTGRTILWQFGLDQFWREPIVGVGFQAYWESPLTTAPYLHFVIKQKLWFFHNNFIDVAVAFGVIGIFVFVAGLVDTLKKIVMFFVARPRYIEAWPMLFFAQIMIFSCLECVLFLNHGLHQLLFAAILPVSTKIRLKKSAGLTPDGNMYSRSQYAG